MKEKVSIVIPCYNAENYIEKCIKSIISQTYTNIEIILINDGSTDNTLKHLIYFELLDSRVILVNQLNKGVSESRNIGIDIAKGVYILFIDNDDWIDIDYIEQMVKKINNYDLILCSYYKEFKMHTSIRQLNISGVFQSSFIQRRIVGLMNDELSDPSQADSIVTVWAKLYKSKIIKDNSIKFISLKIIGSADDVLFNLQYLEYSKEVLVFDVPFYHYRKHNFFSITSTYKKDLFYKWLNLFNYILKTIKSKDSIYSEAYYNRVCLSLIGLGLNEIQNPNGYSDRIKNIKQILNHPLYRTAYKQLQLNYFPFHWKLFFAFAKYKLALGVYFMLLGVNYFVNKNN